MTAIDERTSGQPVLTLRDALKTNREPASETLQIGLVCGFTPLHLKAFIPAYVRRARPHAQVAIHTGTYGDVVMAAEDLANVTLDATVVLMDWADLDPRLSSRRTGSPADADDVIVTTQRRLSFLQSRIGVLATQAPVLIAPPQLAFPSYFPARHDQASQPELQVRSALAAFLGAIAESPNVRVAGQLDQLTGDVAMLWKADFPYTTADASRIAGMAARLLFPPPAKKGLITDLDDTLWRGLVGEVGTDGVTWDLDRGSQGHALYQQLLARLAERGVLIAVASKNEQSVVDLALERPDLRVPSKSIYPVIASWSPKSDSVARILQAWNIGAGDVVMVDDNPMELAQISEQFPTITTRRFVPDDADATMDLIADLTTLFARDGEVGAEDALRVASLKAGAEFTQQGEQADDYTSFLADIDAELTITYGEAHTLPRAYELVQKTNQFNLNGRRHELAQWQALGERPSSVSATVRYADKFGELGVVSVLSGSLNERTLRIESWVLSCRAFSRAVEHHLLRALAERLDVDAIEFDFVATERNGPLQTFLASVCTDIHTKPVTLARSAVSGNPLDRLHRIYELPNTETTE